MPPAIPELKLGALASVLGFHLARASVETDTDFRQRIGEPFKLRKVEYALLLLLLVNGPMAPKALGRALSLSAPNLSLQLERIEERGLISRKPNPLDGRSQHIALTAGGKRLASKAAAATPSIQSAPVARLSPAEHAMLIELLRKVCDKPGTTR